ncbi:Eco57I restriction-modification methylase domain-containing protein [Microbacterium gorillae]|uniref:Eco57I restriction-modification methylase domain-containing protein n=1 Tax=Microbacterium gorillae TaxID=1231063 RepID=UPI003D950C58
MKDEYPESKSDLFAGFIQRCTSLAGQQGMVAMITMQSWMFLSSYEKLRASLLTRQRITSMTHLGARAFDSIGGEVVSSTAFTLANVPPAARGDARKRAGIFIRLVDGTSEAEKVAALRTALAVRTAEAGFHRASDADFTAIPGSPIVYWLSEKMRAVFQSGTTLADVVTTREGLTTGDNNRFLKFWWEPSARGVALPQSLDDSPPPGKRWFAYLKGGTERCWSGNFEYVVDWEHDGERQRLNIEEHTGRVRSHNYNGEWAFRAGITWTGLTSGRFCGRAMGKGFMFDAKGPVAFPHDGRRRDYLLSILNSSVGTTILKMLAPTMDFKLGQIEKVPLPATTPDVTDQLSARCEALIATSVADWDVVETAWDFADNPLVTIAKRRDP